MNRIYKVIYSKARQCYIVVSELAKSNHKSSQQGADRTNTPALARIIAVALAAGALTWGSVPEVSWAADTGQADTGQNATTIQGGIHYFSVNPEGGNRNKNYENDGAVGDDSLAVGAGAHADGRMGATALGNDAVANGERALAVGNGSKATGLNTIAIGTGSQGEADGKNAIAIGNQSHAKGMYTTTVGGFSEATAEGAVALGQQAKSKGAYSTSIGIMANGMGDGGTAADHSTAVGAYSESSGLASVALGGFSKATDKFASALGYGSKAGLRGTAVGAASQVSAEGGTAVGLLSKASATGSVALGMSSVADREAGWQGYHPVSGQMVDTSPAWQSSWGAISVGAGASQDENSKPIPQQTRQIINLAAGTQDTDAVNVAQLKNVMNMPVHIYSGGTINTTGTQITNNMTISNLQLDFGDGLKAQEVGNDGDKRVLVTLDKDALKNDPAFKGPKGDKGDTGAQGPKGDKGDTGAQGPAGKDGKDGKDGGVGTVTDDGSNITVTNTETDSTKPANYQVSLKKDINIDSVTADKVTAKEMTTDRLTINKDVSIEQGSKNAVNAGTVYNETRVKQDGKYVKASNTAGQNITALDNQVASNASNITNINGRVNNLDSKVNKVGAGAAALAALHPLDFDPEDKWDFAVGYGNYRDANSVAVGAFYRPDDDTMFSVGTNFGNGENMINAGVSFKFGPKGKSQVRPGSTQEITELRATVARQDDQLKKQDSEIKELKAMVQQLLAAQDKKAATK
ncbi:ESPR-type extended signal peptide-containing protein [Mitsuokella multacida]|uniref:ESPR-type extended signal peptide-containing protein n=1 Tax=Mitsuokella multacida TaxID=52226 RepID=UPI0026590C17|nr:ESPR-type extended signal peptide-containing protein [Mitsuokella multacida]